MFEAFEERMTSMLENFEIKMRENTDSCKKALNGSMVRFWTAIIAMVQIPGYLCASCSVGFRLHLCQHQPGHGIPGNPAQQVSSKIAVYVKNSSIGVGHLVHVNCTVHRGNTDQASFEIHAETEQPCTTVDHE